MKVIYPGSFDPITCGHVDIIQRLTLVFPEVYVLVAHSKNKQTLFSFDERVEFIQRVFQSSPNVKVDSFSGLTTDYMKKHEIKMIVRGLRAVSDYEYELTMAQMNKKLFPECETLFLQSSPQLTFISSRGVKEVAHNHGSLEGLVPAEIQNDLIQKIRKSHAISR
jgi:pantetheine-phosphate adenylyltransferase